MIIVIIIIVINTVPNIIDQHAYAAQMWRTVASVNGVKRVVSDSRDDLMCSRRETCTKSA